ncbi:hypothetical protein [Namhaeicola litoreus]|uniref:Lipid/polyisoprenoid-binding YceI-like domain-containing protein n=1 Tax=Namhaeicola litoreus TaxID=1052145 RepID=A0ABW3XZ94_9FLAO
MKTFIKLFILLLASIGFYACSEDSVDELLEKDLSITEKIEIPVHVDKTNGTWATFDNSKEISIDNAQTQDYLNRVKAVKIKSLTYRIMNFNGDPNGQVEASFHCANQLSLANTFVVQTAAQNMMQYQINEIAELNRIGQALKNGKKMQARYTGKALCDQADMDFVVQVTLEATVTVGL